MRNLYSTLLLTLLCGMAAQAQTDDYQPLVREGVRWVNYHEAFYDDYSCYFYNYEFHGDTIINNKTYKKCYRYSGKSLDLKRDTAFCAMRDEGHKVYEVPFDLYEDFASAYWSIMDYGNCYDEFLNTGEFTLFDFDNPMDPWASYNTPVGTKALLNRGNSEQSPYVPGVGFDGGGNGDAFHPYTAICTCEYYDMYGFHHMEDLDGNVLYEGRAFDLIDTRDYQPLVREGVVWHYAYEDFELDEETYMPIDSTYRIIDQKMEFRGDTTIHGIEYKKCYLYETDQLAPDEPPFVLAREHNGKVIFAPTHFDETANWDDGNFYHPEGTLPGPYAEILGEYITYDFYDMAGFLQELGWPTLVSTSRTVVGEDSVYCYQTNISGKYVESVGFDGTQSGYLNDPFPIRVPCICPDILGLIMLTDLDGNILYKGNYYHLGYELPNYDLNHDGVIDIADVNIMINVFLGYDVPTGNQGHDTAPTISPDEYYDITGDGHVDITDVNAIINKMLGK